MSKKIKVLYIVSTLRRSGPTNQLLYIISNLDFALFEVSVLTLSEEPNDSMKKHFKDVGIDINSLNLSRFRGFVKGKRKLRSFVSMYKPDVIHTQGIRADGYIKLFQKFKLSVVTTIRCIPSEDYPAKFGKFLGNIMAYRHLKSLRRHNNVVAVSYSHKKVLENYNLKTQVIQNACDTIKYKPALGEEKTIIRENLNLPKDKTILISVGQLVSGKDPLMIIEAFKNSVNRDTYHLLFLGNGNLYDKCLELTIDDNDIEFKGLVSNVEEYLRASDIFISASHSEGLPNTVLESLSSGLPTILSNIPQHVEIFGDKVSDYTFFTLNNSKELQAIIENLDIVKLKNLPTREIIERNFEANEMSKKYQYIYRQSITKFA